jgi:Rrf2 family protein
MLVTKETDYAVRCILYLARKKGQRTVVDEISTQMLIPKHYLAKILQRLVRAGIVESTRGIGGGYRLLGLPSKLSLLDIMIAIQGAAPINVCALDRRSCQLSSSCSVHPVWVEIRRDVENRLKRETISKLITRGKLHRS